MKIIIIDELIENQKINLFFFYKYLKIRPFYEAYFY